MKLAYVTTKDAEKLGKKSHWSGTSYHIAQSLRQHGVSLDYLGPLQDKWVLDNMRKLKRRYYELFYKKVYLKDYDPLVLRSYANQVFSKLSDVPYDAILSATINPIAYLNPTQPLLFWADATFKNTAEFYPKYSNLCQESLTNGHNVERLALQKCKFAIYSSDWAAQTAIEFYKVDPRKVRVIPFGSNLKSKLSETDIEGFINSRPSTQCKLIFIGLDWLRKGGDTAIEVARGLNQAGLPTELTLVGSQPSEDSVLPNFVKPLGYISKFTESGQQKLAQLIAGSHFLILPTIADCSPIVLCEANSCGVPCLATDVGGIPTIIKSESNGKLFNIHDSVADYCDYIIDLFFDYSHYKKMAFSSYNEYKNRLNWTTSGNLVRDLLFEALS